MVQPIDADYDLYAFISFFQVSNTLLDLRILQSVDKFLRVDTDNELVCADEAVFILDLVWDFGACIAGGV